MIRQLRTAFLIFALTAGNALAFDVTALGGLNLANTHLDSYTNIQNPKRSVAITYGVLASFHMFPMIWFETGAMQVGKKFEFLNTTLGRTQKVSHTAIEIPALLRVYLPFISVGAGGYYQKIDRDFEYDGSKGFAADIAPGDYGLKGSLRLSLPILPLFRLVAEGQYLHGLKDRNLNPSLENRNRELRALAGVTLAL